MSINEKETVEAAQAAFVDLLELAELAAEGDSSVESQALREEAQSTVLMLIAAVMLADGQYDEGEQEFIRLLVDSRDKAGGEVSYLNDYAARWTRASMEVPGFYCAAVRRDSRDGTDIAWKMRCRIQIIGNYASIADGKFVASERDTVRRYVAFLEDYADAWREQMQIEIRDDAPCGSEEVANLGGSPIGGSGASERGDTAAGNDSGPKGWLSID
jgi:tellurite resistance protein